MCTDGKRKRTKQRCCPFLFLFSSASKPITLPTTIITFQIHPITPCMCINACYKHYLTSLETSSTLANLPFSLLWLNHSLSLSPTFHPLLLTWIACAIPLDIRLWKGKLMQHQVSYVIQGALGLFVRKSSW
jgi:uncharacterized protein (DUF2062 family)